MDLSKASILQLLKHFGATPTIAQIEPNIINDRFRHLASHDIDEARYIVADIYSEHTLNLKRYNDSLDYTQHYIMTDVCGLSLIRYGAEIQVRAEELEDFFLVQMPLSGYDCVQLESGFSLDSCTHFATVHGPEERFTMNWSADCYKFVVSISRDALEQRAQALLGASLRVPLTFRHTMDTRVGGGLAWKQMALQMLADLHQPHHLFGHSLVREQFEGMLVSGLLAWQPSTLNAQLAQRSVAPALPHHVRSAEDYMHAHLKEIITVSELAAYAGVSVRTLQQGFAVHRNTTPLRYLRELRLEKVHQALVDPSEPRSVTDIALRWGFGELGRFAQAYRQQYGERPSDTLKRRVK